MPEQWSGAVRQIDAYRWEIPQDYKPGMRVPGLIFANERLFEQIRHDQALEQVANVAFLPGIVGRSLAMPDIHWGYGFPVGGVAATRVDDGVISPGGIGFDINCGTRLIVSNLLEKDVRPKLEELTNALFHNVPSGIGSQGKIRVGPKEMTQVLTQGARWAVEAGYGFPEDLEVIEEGGQLKGANPDEVSQHAKQRGVPQLGTLGAGNHFLEVQIVDQIFDGAAAQAMGIQHVGQVVIFFHCGSRGLGYQVCSDYLKVMEAAVRRYGFSLPDRQLACAPVKSPEGKSYWAAMACAANFAWANRQCITHWIRESFSQVFRKSPRELGLHLVYDVAHNIAKLEEYEVDGRRLTLCIHRKGATRSFPPGHADVPAKYKAIGQPVLIPGDMGRASYLLVGMEGALVESFGSTCHGAGRVQSRTAAKKSLRGVDIAAELAKKGILVRATNRALLAEEASEAYKDVNDVVEVCEQAGLSRRVARMRPMGVVKG
ncbi:MAG: RtcB family protein [Chloroflexi bacterium]|nr:RtcB family protein [Chloroflexota bacterium]